VGLYNRPRRLRDTPPRSPADARPSEGPSLPQPRDRHAQPARARPGLLRARGARRRPHALRQLRLQRRLRARPAALARPHGPLDPARRHLPQRARTPRPRHRAERLRPLPRRHRRPGQARRQPAGPRGLAARPRLDPLLRLRRHRLGARDHRPPRPARLVAPPAALGDPRARGRLRPVRGLRRGHPRAARGRPPRPPHGPPAGRLRAAHVTVVPAAARGRQLYHPVYDLLPPRHHRRAPARPLAPRLALRRRARHPRLRRAQPVVLAHPPAGRRLRRGHVLLRGAALALRARALGLPRGVLHPRVGLRPAAPTEPKAG
jgi:hypothetical protein